MLTVRGLIITINTEDNIYKIRPCTCDKLDQLYDSYVDLVTYFCKENNALLSKFFHLENTKTWLLIDNFLECLNTNLNSNICKQLSLDILMELFIVENSDVDNFGRLTLSVKEIENDEVLLKKYSPHTLKINGINFLQAITQIGQNLK